MRMRERNAAVAAAAAALYQGRRAQIYKLDALFDGEIAEGTPAAAAATVVDRRAQDGSLVREGLTTRSKNGGSAIRSVGSSSPLTSRPISRTTLARSLPLGLRSPLGSGEHSQALVISDATSYFTRASPDTTFLCGSYDIGTAEGNRGHPVTGRKLTAAGRRNPIWMRRPDGSYQAACGNLAGGASLTIDRRRGSTASERVTFPTCRARTYIACMKMLPERRNRCCWYRCTCLSLSRYRFAH